MTSPLPLPTCGPSPSFNLLDHPSLSEWPSNLPGYICKTPPRGPQHAARFAQCCSGPLYNITTPTTPDHPAYPMSCALVCQVDPLLDQTSDIYPYGWSEHFMCLTNGGMEPSTWFVGCAMMPGPAPGRLESSWTGDWQTWKYPTGEGRSIGWEGAWFEEKGTGGGWVSTSPTGTVSVGGSTTTSTSVGETDGPGVSASVSASGEGADGSGFGVEETGTPGPGPAASSQPSSGVRSFKGTMSGLLVGLMVLVVLS